MEEFERIRDTLLAHLPRPVVDGAVRLDRTGLYVDERGVSIGDLADMLADLTGQDGFVPDGMPVRDIAVRNLALTPSALPGNRVDLVFTVGWEATGLSVADTFPLRVAEARFLWKDGELTAVADVTLRIDDLDLEAELELPSQIVSVRLAPEKHASADAFLANRGLVAGGGRHTLHALIVKASIPFRHLVVHVELEDLFEIGPVHLVWAMAEAVLAGTHDGNSLEAAARIEIDAGRHGTVALQVHGRVDSGGWALGGGLDLTGQGVTIAEIVRAAAGALNDNPPKLPDAISGLALAHIGVGIDTHDQSFELDCALDWTGRDAEIVVHVSKRGTALSVTGTLTLGETVLKVAFDQAGAALLVGSYDAAGARKITLDEMLSAVGIDAHAAFGGGGTGVAIGVGSLGVALDAQARMLLAAEIDAGVDLSRLGDLPVVGALLPKGEPLGLRINPYYLSPGFADPQRAKDLLPAQLRLPDQLQDNFGLSAELHLGGAPIALPSVDLGASPANAAPPKASAKAAATPDPAAAPLKWIDIGKSLGPVHIDRVGWAMSGDTDKSIDLAFDGSLSVAGLTLSLSGLGARYRFSDQSLSPHLQGIGLDLNKGPVAISGAFLNVGGDFGGKITIGTPKFSIAALGAFKMIDGAPSVFLFGVLGMPLGGPPFFFVEGLAAGVGIHRRLHQPKIEKVREFPLVAAARDTAAGTPPAVDAEAQLRALHEYIEPRLGHYFLAAGLKFNTFRLLHGNLLAIVQFGRDLEIDVIGTADFSSPPELPPSMPAMARVQLDMTARILPAEGLIAVEARLNPKSYVYGPLCHLSGGFAFYSWMSGAHAGDFVLSVGGYSPHYKVPAHYPRVPRVELRYAISDDVTLKGDAYFAMTPAVMMAGGGLHADARIGSLHAWANLTVDFLVRWQPFHYDAWLHLDIGASWKCFHTTASADLHIWGPKLSGIATVEWSIFSFDVEFGPRTVNLPMPITFDAFERAYLGYDDTPESRDATLGISISRGIVGQAGDLAIVAPSELAFETSSRVPITHAALGGSSLRVARNPSLGIAPVFGQSIGTSEHVVTVRRDGDDVSADFKATTTHQYAQFPPALWGTVFEVARDAKPISALAGIAVEPRRAMTSGRSNALKVADLRYHINASPIALAGFADAVESGQPATDPGTSPETAVRLMLTGVGANKISVIKAVRKVTGLGLKEAKEFVEAKQGEIVSGITRAEAEAFARDLRESGASVSIAAPIGTTTGTPTATPAPPETTVRLMLTGVGAKKISVIKAVRKVTGLGLKEAKEFVEAGQGEIVSGISRVEAEAIARDLRESGASVSIVAPTGTTTGTPTATPTPPETTVRLMLTDVGAKKISVIKAVRKVTGLGLKEAKEFVEAGQGEIVSGITRAEAEAFARDLRESGASVSIVAPTGTAAGTASEAPTPRDLPMDDLAALGIDPVALVRDRRAMAAPPARFGVDAGVEHA